MLFNSYIFVFLFLPIVLLVFALVGKFWHYKAAISWLVISSLFFYGWWNPSYLGLILFSIIFNYAVGVALLGKRKKALLLFGIAGNILLLGYFKYANFFLDNVNYVLGNSMVLEEIILPLAISFFTFQQITYLVDAFNGETREYSFLYYCLFVLFFPQLIAGPIVHHKEMMPQFESGIIYKLKSSNLIIGISIFFIGLFKKTVFADTLAIYATSVFTASEIGIELTFFESWVGAIAYTFQLYFDFSGYSDMAIGIARMFGIILPINFFSPYKANNIADFWRRWHITLSNFIKEYLYYPINLSMTRYAVVNNTNPIIKFIITIIIPMTFVWFLTGLWHGAGWTFILWGLIHGMYLIIFQLWTDIRSYFRWSRDEPTFFGIATSRIVTFTAVIVSFVMFRSESINGAMSMYHSMFGFSGISLPMSFEAKLSVLGEIPEMIGIVYNGMFYNGVLTANPDNIIILLFIMLIIVWFSPNVTEWFRFEKPALRIDGLLKKGGLYWRRNTGFALITIFIASTALMFIQRESEFLYFQF